MNEDTTTLNETETASKNKVARKVTKKSAAKKKSTKAKTAKATKSIRTYPSITLEKCLIIAQKIKELNGGNPWPLK